MSTRDDIAQIYRNPAVRQAMVTDADDNLRTIRSRNRLKAGGKAF